MPVLTVKADHQCRPDSWFGCWIACDPVNSMSDCESTYSTYFACTCKGAEKDGVARCWTGLQGWALPVHIPFFMGLIGDSIIYVYYFSSCIDNLLIQIYSVD